MAIRSKLTSYSEEIAHCFSIGCSLGDGCKLAWSTLGFHLANGLRLKENGSPSPPARHTVRYAGKTIEIFLRRQGGDMFIFHEVFCYEAYRPPRQIGSDVRTVVDLGANIGLTTLYFQQYFPNASYLCVEPNPANAALLRRNVAWMGLGRGSWRPPSATHRVRLLRG